VKKLVYVKDVEDITAVPYVARELMLIKVGCGL
jgi:acetolactate synthase small subunit